MSQISALKRAVHAILLVSLGLVITIAILSYSPFDATGDTAVLSEKTKNFFNAPGANLANWMLQLLGWAALPLGLLILFAAIRSVIKPPLGMRKRDIARRAGLLVSTIFFLTICLAAFPVPQSWPMGTGIGGWIGDGLFQSIKNLFISIKINAAISGGVTAFLAFIALGYCFGRFIGMVGRDVAELLDAAGLVWAITRVKVDTFIAFLRKRFQKSYVDPVEQAGFEDKHVWMETPGVQTTTAVPTAQSPQIHITPTQTTTAPATAQPSPQPVATTPIPQQAEVSYTHAAPEPAAVATRATAKAEKYKFAKNSDFILPSIDLLNQPPPRAAVTDAGALRKSAEDLSTVLSDFGVLGEIGAVRPGPVVTLYEFVPAAGVKSSRVINLADDIARSMAAQSARVAVVPGRNAIGIELPNRRRETVYLKDMLASKAFLECGHSLPIALGEDIGGKPYFADLAKMPHLLVAGTTGSGKSVGINAMILSIMYTLTPEECKFIMIDPKMLELSVYDEAPHLLTPVVTNPKKAVVALKWAVREMESRYKKMAKMNVRSIAGYNEKVRVAKSSGKDMTHTVMTGYSKETGEPIYETQTLDFDFMPFIVIVIDEMADLMMVAGKDIEGAVQRLAQMARAAGIHMIMATQRPSVDVITGTIKANFPTRISFSVSSKIDSRTILGEQGGEQLLGMGDMLYLAGGGRPRRLHGPFVSDEEVEKIASFIKAQGAPSYLEDVTVDKEEEAEAGGPGGNTESGDEMFDKAVAIVANDRKASTSYIQRRLGIGYNRAATLIERMEADGMIGPSGPGGKREIFLPEAEGY
ncbi:MAG: cell division protein FtsK [Robiginitomaculum sp.]|nr:MAG: cell division protein FtsK [Robiginitomaculum sp.]